MNAINRLHYAVFLGVLCLWGFESAYSQVSEKQVISFLNTTKQVNVSRVTSEALEQVSEAEIYKATAVFNLVPGSWSNPTKESYFLKSGKSLQPFASPFDIITSSDFVNSFKNDFKLKSEEDALEFQMMLGLFDDHPRNVGCFKYNNSWYFIRNEFFNQIEHYKVATNEAGTVEAISYASSLDIEIPEQLLGKGTKSGSVTKPEKEVGEKVKVALNAQMAQLLNYRFEVTDHTTAPMKQVSEVQFFEGNIIFKEKEGEHFYEVSRPVMVVATNAGYETVNNYEGIVKSELFIQSLKEFHLKSVKDVTLLSNALASLHTAEIEEQEPFQKENIWFLPWRKSEDQTEGYLLKINADDAIQHMDYSSFRDRDIIRFKMKDPDYKADFNFTLVSPQSDKIELNAGSGLPVTIQYKEEVVNACGAWILTRHNGKKVGFEASTSMEAPFRDEIPAKALAKGQHIVEYLLLPPGRNTDKPYGIIKLEINVN